MFDVGGGELILILLVVILLFGPKKLPELARSFGKGMRHVRKAQEDLTQQIRDISADVTTPVTQVSDAIKKDIKISIDDNSVARAEKVEEPKESLRDEESKSPREE